MTDFYQTLIYMMAIWPATKVPADLEIVSQGRQLQKSLYLGYYMTDFNQSFTKLMQLGLAEKGVTSDDLYNFGQVYISQSNISYYQNDFNQILFQNYDSSTGVVAFVYRRSFLFPS